ncbi:Uncharacterized protein TCM_030075 [Theobroma cacao]|uniref:Uncharacterized protein n=1 Tax=Theobroma cacao TaxID=3641 RepID=A0A061GH88_THECC|nr:Uncharacterized protein TCM_030075 [Theobroma cacao]
MRMYFSLKFQLFHHVVSNNIFTASTINNDITNLPLGCAPCIKYVVTKPTFIFSHHGSVKVTTNNKSFSMVSRNFFYLFVIILIIDWF